MSADQPDWIRPLTPRADARCIVSAGLGYGYRRLLRSTENHCAVHCPECWRLFFDVLPAGCPSHQESHYKFKVEALRCAVAAGFRSVLWMDATLAPIAGIERIWDHIDREGYFAIYGGAQLGEYVSDAALAIYGITRDEAMVIPLAASGLTGFNRHHELGNKLWDGWERLCGQGAFEGAHRNTLPKGSAEKQHGNKFDGWCSDDPRAKGHRHDEAALSFVLHQIGVKPVCTERAFDWGAFGVGSHVPDYDVVKMRAWILERNGPAELCR